ncbi:MAG: NUDIX domain-containing protein [Verrucomicrobiae bacterium]|nr:NUDIX domain-containing protein [Verrucomicrobiae bacterium]
MKEEIFDVVDEKDRVIGQVTRREIHEKKLLHRAIHIFIFDSRNRLFLQKRSLMKDSHPGKWDSSCSGHLDTGETYAIAAQRELKEELGITFSISTADRILYLPASEATDQEFIQVFRLMHPGPFQLHPEEISEGQFFEIHHIQQWIEKKPEDFATAFHTIFHKFLTACDHSSTV